MDIKTKFDVGDGLFLRDCKCEYMDSECTTCDGKGKVEIKGDVFECPKCKGNKILPLTKRTYSVKKAVIKSINIMVDEKGEIDISYNFRTENSRTTYACKENMIDDTYLKKSKAEKECAKRNSEAVWEMY